MLLIKNLSVALKSEPSLLLSRSSDLASYGGQAAIVKNLSIAIAPGTVHAIMGSNGSGKSTLAYTLMGHPNYTITAGSITYKDQDVASLSPDKRAKLGIFLAFQHPYEIPGVTVLSFLKSAHQAITGIQLGVKEFQLLLLEAMELLAIDPLFAHRALNVGFSGGEKKRLEMLQLIILHPSLIILDEIDSGLDIDALKVVAHGLQQLKEKNPDVSIIMITHNPRMLDYLKPHMVHIMHQGTIIKSGDLSLVSELEAKGYDAYNSQ